MSHWKIWDESGEDVVKECGGLSRYAATGSCNIFVFVITWVFLETSDVNSDSNQLGTGDATAFTYVVFIVVGTGVFFTVVFHLGVKEPSRDCSVEFATQSSKRSAANWRAWFREPLFYKVGVLYMCVRVIINVTQCYIPMYTLETLDLSKRTIAIMPLVVYLSGLVSTLFTKPLNKCLGRKTVFLGGLFMILGTSIWLWLIPPHSKQMYFASVALGYGGSTLLVTVLTMLADLIGNSVETGAFVYGAMSFLDKMSNGVIIQIIQLLYPKNTDKGSSAGGLYYREVMVFASGVAAVIALLALATPEKKNLDKANQETHGATSNTWLQSGSWSLVCSSKGPFFASYESPAQLVLRREATEDASESLAFYGSMEL
ncbi:hypothetical protein pdam_00019331 [Pocillopora damicornis]|uniref:Major facilitator superfamily (MFS) profile domain-containing protein n=1 Tax=Pocillopora damicornis TaxID=46731 RepID=A0A3M6U1K0_POCDA|nr:hypothetical protein pdam_00019331 [Pocillopora damicornis]